MNARAGLRLVAVAVALCAGCVCSTAFTHPRGQWTKLILTQHWPLTFCSMEKCKTDLSYWTLHGLWPNTGVRCNTSWHFNASLIEDIIPEMEKVWPDLLEPTSPKFWSYEWQKHGTCAAKAESMNSEHKYFSKALELYHKFDLNGVLRNSNIVPSEEHHYTLDDVETALTSSYHVKPKIQCVHPGKGGQVQTLGQIEICVDPDFQLINCERSSDPVWSSDQSSGLSVCDPSMPIYYPPLPSRS